MNDLRFALKQFAKSPGSTAVVVLTLALGIGAVTTVFCWLQHSVLLPIPGVRDQVRIVALVTPSRNGVGHETSLPDQKEVAKLKDVFAGVVGSTRAVGCVTIDGNLSWANLQLATSNFFEVLGVRPILGRTFALDDDSTNDNQPALVLSESYWRRMFDSDPNVIGRSMRVNQGTFTVIGVVPAAFHGTEGGLQCDFWAPVAMRRAIQGGGKLDSRNERWLHTQARLQSGVSLAKAQAALDTLMRQLEQTYPETNEDIGMRALPMWAAPYGAQQLFLTPLTLLFAVSIGVLFVVVANTGNLQLCRATARRKEIAIRCAVGAGRWQIIRQLLVESSLLGLMGGVLGIVLAAWGSSILGLLQPETYLPLAPHAGLDGRTIAFSGILAVATGVLFGLAPALQLASENTNAILMDAGRGAGEARSHHRVRNTLVVFQIAFALGLLVCAGICLRSSSESRKIDPGFDPENVLLAGLRIETNGYNDRTAPEFYRKLEARLAGLPGVKSAALSSRLPLGFEGGSNTDIDVEGYDLKRNEKMMIPYAMVSPRYFETLRIPLLEGRDFTAGDGRETQMVAIINEYMARRYWPGQNPVGRRFTAFGRSRTIIAVVKGGKYSRLNEEPTPFFYVPHTQSTWTNLVVVVRAEGDARALVSTLREQVRAIDPGVTIWASMPMKTFTIAAYYIQDTLSKITFGLGMIALGLASLGIYGVTAFTVGRRTQEIGVRIALGAGSRDIMSLILRGGLRLLAIGAVLGLVFAFAGSRVLTSFLPGLGSFDPLAFSGALLTLAAAVLVACWLPARRATKVDPMVALREE